MFMLLTGHPKTQTQLGLSLILLGIGNQPGWQAQTPTSNCFSGGGQAFEINLRVRATT